MDPALVEKPALTLDELLKHYVQLDFISEYDRERVLEKLIRQNFTVQQIEGFRKAKVTLKLGEL